MEKLIAVLTAMGIALTADQTKELTEVVGKEFVPVADASADKTKLQELTKQLADRDADIAKLKGENKSEELAKQLSDLEAKYKQDTDALNDKLSAQASDHAAEKLFSGYNFTSERVKNSILAEFKEKGFKLENGEFLGGKEYLEGLKKSEPTAFVANSTNLFMGATQSTAPVDANNLESQIFESFGLQK